MKMKMRRRRRTKMKNKAKKKQNNKRNAHSHNLALIFSLSPSFLSCSFPLCLPLSLSFFLSSLIDLRLKIQK